MSRVDAKVVLLGHEAVGKTSLMQRYINDRFNDSSLYQNTIGSAFASKYVKVDDKELIIGLWDTAGSERYYSMTKTYYRGAAAAIVCYDVTRSESFDRAKFWISELRSVEENCRIYLCGTKSDLLGNTHEANPSLDKVEKYAEGVQIKFFLTSSKTGENVDELFNMMVQDYLADPIHEKKIGEFIVLGTESKHSRCCPLI